MLRAVIFKKSARIIITFAVVKTIQQDWNSQPVGNAICIANFEIPYWKLNLKCGGFLQQYGVC